MVDFRCPECFALMQRVCTREDAAELDRRQVTWRQEMAAAYERSVVESMEALASCLVTALALDLVGADDFAPRRARRAAP